MREANHDSAAEDTRPLPREPDLEMLSRETRWELIGCVVLLAIAVLMAAAVNAYVP
jgi:hypothetical protein